MAIKQLDLSKNPLLQQLFNSQVSKDAMQNYFGNRVSKSQLYTPYSGFQSDLDPTYYDSRYGDAIKNPFSFNNPTIATASGTVDPKKLDDLVAEHRLTGILDEADEAKFRARFSDTPMLENEVNLKGGSNMGATMAALGAQAKAHPFITAGTAANGAMNVAGLFDNDKILGQAIGTAAGAILPKFLGMGLSPLASLNVAMGAGNLGAMFDIMRSKKEQQKYNRGGNR